MKGEDATGKTAMPLVPFLSALLGERGYSSSEVKSWSS